MDVKLIARRRQYPHESRRYRHMLQNSTLSSDHCPTLMGRGLHFQAIIIDLRIHVHVQQGITVHMIVLHKNGAL